jgi:hypothetical protein
LYSKKWKKEGKKASLFDFFDFVVKNLAAGAAAGMPLFPEVIAAKRQLLAIRQWRIDGVCRSRAGRDAVL